MSYTTLALAFGVCGRSGHGELRHRRLADVGVRTGERLVLHVVDDAGGVHPEEGAGRELVVQAASLRHGPVGRGCHGLISVGAHAAPAPRGGGLRVLPGQE
jgi:hypothetical protein